MSRSKAWRSKVRKIRARQWIAEGYARALGRLPQNNLYGLSPAQCVLLGMDEWSTPAQVAAMEKELPEIQRVLQPYRDSGQLR